MDGSYFVGPDDGAKSIIEGIWWPNMGLLGRVRMLDLRDDVDELLAITDVFVLPSYREGMPRSVIGSTSHGSSASGLLTSEVV